VRQCLPANSFIGALVHIIDRMGDPEAHGMWENGLTREAYVAGVVLQQLASFLKEQG
jgi:hypothetical protein